MLVYLQRQTERVPKPVPQQPNLPINGFSDMLLPVTDVSTDPKQENVQRFVQEQLKGLGTNKEEREGK